MRGRCRFITYLPVLEIDSGSNIYLFIPQPRVRTRLPPPLSQVHIPRDMQYNLQSVIDSQAERKEGRGVFFFLSECYNSLFRKMPALLVTEGGVRANLPAKYPVLSRLIKEHSTCIILFSQDDNPSPDIYIHEYNIYSISGKSNEKKNACRYLYAHTDIPGDPALSAGDWKSFLGDKKTETGNLVRHFLS